MGLLFRIVFLISLGASLGRRVITEAASDDFEPAFDPEEYDGGDEEQFWPPPLHSWKRAGFWSPHPSDYNPMRRPGSTGQTPRTSSKKSTENPYHPVPRTVHQNQRNNQNTNPEDLEGLIEGLRDKRQSPGSFLLMKLGRLSKVGDMSRRMGRRKP